LSDDITFVDVASHTHKTAVHIFKKN